VASMRSLTDGQEIGDAHGANCSVLRADFELTGEAPRLVLSAGNEKQATLGDAVLLRESRPYLIASHSKQLRLLGVVNLVFVGAGVAGLAFQMWASSLFQVALTDKGSSAISGANQAGQIAAGLCLASLVYASIRLLQTKAHVIGFASGIFVAELVYVALAAMFLWIQTHTPQLALKGVIIFNLGIAPQILTGYPVIAITLLTRLEGRSAKSPA